MSAAHLPQLDQYTILQEGIITAAMLMIGLSPHRVKDREFTSHVIHSMLGKIQSQDHKVEDRRKWEEAWEKLNYYRDDLKSFASLTDYRNDFNHNGMRESSIKNPKKFNDGLIKRVEELEPFIHQVSNRIQSRGDESG